jgi:hypothetical protein
VKLWPIIILFCLSASATTYYVDNGGSDGNTGLSGHPWQHVGYALSNAASGSTVLLTSGQTFNQDNIVFSISGVTLGTSASGTATIQGSTGSNVLFAAAAVSSSLSGITVSNLNLYGGNISNTIACIQCYTGASAFATNWTIENCTMSNAQYGIYFFDVNTLDSFDNLTITGNTVSLVKEVGINIQPSVVTGDFQTIGSNAVTANNTVSYVLGDPVANSGSGIVLFDWNGWECYSNVVHDCGMNQRTLGGGAGGIISVFLCNKIHFWGNTVYNIWSSGGNGTNGAGGDGVGIDFDEDTSNSVCEGNFTYNCGGVGYYSFLAGGNNIYRWNIGIGDGTNGEGEIWFADYGHPPTNSIDYVYNNTLIGGLNGISLNPNSGGGTNYVLNNIIGQLNTSGWLIIGDAAAVTNWHFKGNDYMTANFLASWPSGVSNYNGLTAWRSVGQEGGGAGFQVNPQFAVGSGTIASNYWLGAGSPLLNQGIDVHGIYGISAGTSDYYGYSVLGSGNNVGGLVSPPAGPPVPLITQARIRKP